MGVSSGPALERPALHVGGRDDGAIDVHGQVLGTYLHGLFDEAGGLRRAARMGGACRTTKRIARCAPGTQPRPARRYAEATLDWRRIAPLIALPEM